MGIFSGNKTGFVRLGHICVAQWTVVIKVVINILMIVSFVLKCVGVTPHP